MPSCGEDYATSPPLSPSRFEGVKVKRRHKHDDVPVTPYDLFVLLLTILSLVNLFLLVLPIATTTKGVLLVVDIVACSFLLADVVLRIRRAPTPRDYLIRDKGWLDALGSLPFPGLRLFRIRRVVVVSKQVAELGGSRLWKGFLAERAQATLLLVVLLVLVTIEAGSIAVLRAERDANTATIKSASDALWWCMETITTIGYGDEVPVTNAGRIVGVWLMIVGVGLFGTFTAFVANEFLTPQARSGAAANENRELMRRQQELLDRLEARLDALEAIERASPSEVVVAGEPPERDPAPGGRDVEGDEAMGQGGGHRRL
jgi:voltage-gated potassium channel